MKPNFFSTSLLDWFKKNKRTLPWRDTKNPYVIWLSEVILQQTRVAQGLPYFQKFLSHYPTVHDLANASEEQVLKDWQGLGYYSRARNMHATAKFLNENQLDFPQKYSELIKLKGVGEYTASAIASFSNNEKVAVVDGNVYRVLSRYYGIETPIDSSAGKKQFKELANSLLPSVETDQYNQAIMEFGALHCTPKKPKCSNCPLAIDCFAGKTNKQLALPIKAKKQQKKKIYLNYLVITFQDLVMVRKRKGLGVWEGLFDFYAIESNREKTESGLSKEINHIAKNQNVKIKFPTKKYKHILSHIEYQAQFWQVELEHKIEPVQAHMSWYKTEDIKSLPVSRLVEKYLEG